MIAARLGGGNTTSVVEAAASLSAVLPEMPTSATRALLSDIGVRVSLSPDRMAITFSVGELLARLGAGARDRPGRELTIEAPATLVRRGHELRLVLTARDGSTSARVDPKLVQLLARAELAHATLSRDGLPADRPIRAHQVRLARLKLLAPDIVAAILEGRQPPALTARNLLRAPALPIDWAEQRLMLASIEK